MGWSWVCRQVAQRVREFQARIGAGIRGRLLSDHEPVPALATHEPIVLPYYDNLIVAGTCQQRVQAVDDGFVARLRVCGFRVHEEEDVYSHANSLAYCIDGENW